VSLLHLAIVIHRVAQWTEGFALGTNGSHHVLNILSFQTDPGHSQTI